MRLVLSDWRTFPYTGDLTQGAASTGPVLSHSSDAAAGFICVIEADSSGRAEFLNVALNPNLQVWAGSGPHRILLLADVCASLTGLGHHRPGARCLRAFVAQH